MFERSTMNESSADSEPGVINSTINFEKLSEIVAKLRGPGGCPWDREQTHESLLPALIEEAYEVTEAAREKNDARDSGAVLKQWEAIKRDEKKTDAHYLASLPKALPALMRAQKAQSKAARVNFDW